MLFAASAIVKLYTRMHAPLSVAYAQCNNNDDSYVLAQVCTHFAVHWKGHNQKYSIPVELRACVQNFDVAGEWRSLFKPILSHTARHSHNTCT